MSSWSTLTRIDVEFTSKFTQIAQTVTFCLAETIPLCRSWNVWVTAMWRTLRWGQPCRRRLTAGRTPSELLSESRHCLPDALKWMRHIFAIRSDSILIRAACEFTHLRWQRTSLFKSRCLIGWVRIYMQIPRARWTADRLLLWRPFTEWSEF